MPNRSIRIMLLLGGLAIAGILFVQSYLVFQTYDLNEQDFDESVTIVLRKVAEGIAKYNGSELPKQGLIQRRSSNYYSVNVNSAIDANILEDYLYQEFEKQSLAIDFEYAVYDCSNDDLVYGNYCQMSDIGEEIVASKNLPKFNDLIYYFVVRFPSKESFILSNMRQTILFSLIALLAVSFFMYAIWIILRQKQLTELQKDFINNMTHEFKTPISSIKLASDVLIGNESVKNDARLNQYARIIRDQNIRLNNQVEKVLNVARLENNQFKLNFQLINVDETLAKIVAAESIKFEETGGELRSSLDTKGFIIEADPLHFNNVISNILDNALKYCDGVPKAHITTKASIANCTISIKDHGIGIKADDQKKLFTKFYRVPTGNVHNVKGFGLGLFYVKNIAEEHGWQLTLDSQYGKGTTVNIVIPRKT